MIMCVYCLSVLLFRSKICICTDVSTIDSLDELIDVCQCYVSHIASTHDNLPQILCCQLSLHNLDNVVPLEAATMRMCLKSISCMKQSVRSKSRSGVNSTTSLRVISITNFNEIVTNLSTVNKAF